MWILNAKESNSGICVWRVGGGLSLGPQRSRLTTNWVSWKSSLYMSKARPPPDSSARTTLLAVFHDMTGRCYSVLGPIALFFLDHGESK